MNKIESYKSEGQTITKAYNQIYDSLQKMLEIDDENEVDPAVLGRINSGLNLINDALEIMQDDVNAFNKKQEKINKKNAKKALKEKGKEEQSENSEDCREINGFKIFGGK